MVLAARKAGSDLPTCPYPTYRLCLSLFLPTPLNFEQPNLAPNLFFCYFYFYPFFPLSIVP